MIETKWSVITGGPSCGKSSIIRHLSPVYWTVSEMARIYIDEQNSRGKTTEEIRADEAEFQRRVLEKKIEVEEIIPTERVTIFDRGMPDSIAYYQLYGLDESPAREACIRKYKNVFLLDLLPFKKDYARIEDEKTAIRLDKLIENSYRELGYETVRVPVMPIGDRVQFIVDNLK